MIDVDELRHRQIELHGLTRTDRTYTFYHDETNNIRKLHIDERGLNVAEFKTFVLGGIVHEGTPHTIEILSLREALRIQKTACEIKFAHVASGDFLEVLRSVKLTTFLEWIEKAGLTIHYHDLDPLYWSVVDIIESILFGLRDLTLLGAHALLKSDLTATLRSELPSTIALFHAYGYPGLRPEGRKPFLEEIIERLKRNPASLPAFNLYMLKGVLQAGKRLDNLEFIEGCPSNLLIEEFSTFYINRIAIFKSSNHIFDMEDSIRASLLKTQLTSGGRPISNYRFADSKAEPGIQISDIVVGILGKLHTYLVHTEADEVAADRSALTGASERNVELLRDLIDASHDSNIAFLNHVAGVHDTAKLDLFLRFKDGAFAA